MPAKDRATANAQQRKWYRKHKAKHIAKVRQYQQEVHEWFLAFKATCSCPCGESDSRCLDFHHRDPKTKKFNIADRCKRYSKKALQEELDKCDVLCANCHRKQTILL